MFSRSMTTEVSINARSCLGTWRRVLLDERIGVEAEGIEVNRRRALECTDCAGGLSEIAAAQRGEATDRNPIAGHDKRIAAVEPAHDFAAVIAQFALADFPS